MDSIRIGDEVVHQGAPGRFTVVKVEPSPGMNVYSRILTIRGVDGKETKVLDTAVRALPPRPAKDDAPDPKPAVPPAE